MFVLLLLAAAGIYDYNQSAPIDVKVSKTEVRDGIEVRDITFVSASGGRTAAYLVVPKTKGPHPAALMVHWYAPEEQDSNRTQYLGQAVDLATGSHQPPAGDHVVRTEVVSFAQPLW